MYGMTIFDDNFINFLITSSKIYAVVLIISHFLFLVVRWHPP
jgi:hypothetical protein